MPPRPDVPQSGRRSDACTKKWTPPSRQSDALRTRRHGEWPERLSSALGGWPAACFLKGRMRSAHAMEASMRKLGMTLSLAGLALLGACSRGNDARSDDALKNDLALAAQAQPYQAQQFVSPMEAQYGMPYGAQ